MKKSVLFAAFVSILSVAAKAQLTNTKFKGTVQMESSVDILWSFDKDTTRVISLPDSALIETMIYKFDNNILQSHKGLWHLPCDYTTVGKYKVELKDDKLTLTLVEDACKERANAINGTAYTKLK